MTIEHKNIDDNDIHLPKDFRRAAVNTVPTKNTQGDLEYVDLDTLGGNPASHMTRHLPISGGDKLPTIEPSTVGEVNAIGNSDDFVRGNHVHAHGEQVLGNMHAVATQVKNGFLSKEDKIRLDGIEDNATRDQTDLEIKTAYENNANTNEFSDIEKSKLGGIEDNATRDQTATEIKSLYESNTNTNEFSDIEKSKLAGIEPNATADQTATEIKSLYESNINTNAFTDSEKSKLASLETSKYLGQYVSLAALQIAHPSPVVGSYANVDGGIGADVVRYIWDSDDNSYVLQVGVSTNLTDAQIKTQYENNADTNAFTDGEKSKLAGIEPNATQDQSPLEIKVAYESNANTNEFDDIEKAKLAGIEDNATADQTALEIKTAYESNADTNAFTDAFQSKLTGIEPNATADQTALEIKTLYESNANTNEFNDTEKLLLSKLDQGFLQYTSTTNLTTSATFPATTTIPLPSDLSSLPKSYFTKVDATDFRTDFNGYVEINYQANGYNNINNDRSFLIAVTKNGILITPSKAYTFPRADANRPAGLKGSIILTCAPNDVFRLVVSNQEGGNSITLIGGETLFNIKSIERN